MSNLLDLDFLLHNMNGARLALLGEATHGTHEYYQARSEMTKRLITKQKFSFIAVEGDWPECYQLNRYVKNYQDSPSQARDVLSRFSRWPTWMWANEEIADLAEWLRDYNANLPDTEQVGFYGLDVYSLWESLQAVINYLQLHLPSALPLAYRAFRCFEPFGPDLKEYARALPFVPESCAHEVVHLLSAINSRTQMYQQDGESEFNTRQNALVVKNAEKYYRALLHGGAGSWNVRDRHMLSTLDRLLSYHGPRSKGIVWAHNTHIGDARATDMVRHGLINLGQLSRQKYGKKTVALAGFGSYAGRVIASPGWGMPMEDMPVPEAIPASWEDFFHKTGSATLVEVVGQKHKYRRTRGHRAIGVVYDPLLESGNYVPTILSRRYDIFCFIDITTALRPFFPTGPQPFLKRTWQTQ